MSTPALILSIFPGIDLFGMGFEQAGYCVLRGPDPLFGGDVRDFHPPRGCVQGIIGGSPCQDFSRLRRRRTPPTGNGLAMLWQFERIVREVHPLWYLLENVPGVPAVQVPGYTVQRIHVRASEFGAAQHRLRILQFGYRDKLPLILPRLVTNPIATEAAALASDGARGRKRAGWVAFCQRQGLVPAPALSSFTLAGRYRAVGNGVYIPMARAVAMAIARRRVTLGERPCACGCARPVTGRATMALTSCRKRKQRNRDAAGVTCPGADTSGRTRRDTTCATSPRSDTPAPAVTLQKPQTAAGTQLAIA